MAGEGLFDPQLVIAEWFDEGASVKGWFDKDLIAKAGGTSAVNYALSGLSGSYVVTGQSATVKRGYAISGAAGAYAVTGQPATVAFNRKLSGNAGSYSVSGVAANVAYTPGAGSVAYTLSGNTGSYAVSGKSAAVAFNRKLSGSAGSYTVTGVSANATYAADPVAYTLSGLSGSYSVTGQAANAVYASGSGSVAYALSGLSGSYLIAGNDAVAVWSGASVGGGYDDKKKKKYVVRVGDKLMVFSREADALNALPKKNIPQKKGNVVPEEQVALPEIKAIAQSFKALPDYGAMLRARQYEQLINFYETLQQQDEEDVELLLMAA